MELLYILLILLLVTRVFAELAVRLGQPALVGELVSGIALGVIIGSWPEAFPILANLGGTPAFEGVLDLSLFFLMLLGGLELNPKDMADASLRASAAAVSGLLLPLACGFALGWFVLPESELKLAQSLFLGTALAITAVPVTVRVLMDLGQLESAVGKTIVSAAVFDDVLSLILLAMLTGMIETGGAPEWAVLGWLLVKAVLFFAVTIAAGLFVFPFARRGLRAARAGESEFALLLLAGLAFSLLAEFCGLHFILGAFMAGLFFQRQTAGARAFEAVKKKTSAVAGGFLAPIFFASIGLRSDLSAFLVVPGFLAVLIAVGFLSKIVGAGAAAWAAGLSRREALAVGVGMSGRGAVELVIADIALRAGLFERPDPVPEIISSLFSAVVVVAIVTTLATPVLLKWLLPADR